MTNGDGAPDDIGGTGAFSRVLRGVLRPLVRALIAQGVTAPALYRLLKQIYVDVADAEFRIDGQRPTDSRVSVLTGVHRRDVKAMRDEARPATETGAKVTAMATVLGRWLAGPDTLDDNGDPLPLPRTGPSPSFDALARSVSRDIRPRTVLDELTRQGLVEVTGESVRIARTAFVGPADLDQKVHFFAENVGDHIAAAVDNLLAEDPSFMERAVYYNRLTPASVDALEAQARALGAEALIALNRAAAERQAADAEAEDGTERFRFGVFFYREDEFGAQRPRSGEGETDDKT